MFFHVWRGAFQLRRQLFTLTVGGRGQCGWHPVFVGNFSERRVPKGFRESGGRTPRCQRGWPLPMVLKMNGASVLDGTQPSSLSNGSAGFQPASNVLLTRWLLRWRCLCVPLVPQIVALPLRSWWHRWYRVPAV